MAQNLDFKTLVPNYLRNEVLNSLNDNLFNRFVSSEESLLVSGNVGLTQIGDSEIAQSSLERRENALTPGLYFSSGTEQHLFTFADMVNKMESIGVDVANMRSWAAEQNFNLTPPIDVDKFVNYTNYYWAASALSTESLIWNPELVPEYYVIRRPKANDPLVKMPVRLATDRDIALWANDRAPETITITFTSAMTFTVSSNLSLDPDAVQARDESGLVNGTLANPISSALSARNAITIWAKNTASSPSVNDPNLSVIDYYPILELTIENGRTAAFSAGDTITVDVVYFTSQIQSAVNSPNLVGKGTVTGVRTVSPLMFIDGVQVADGDRILAWQQIDPTKNGIYVVRKGQPWSRAADSSLNEHFTVGQTIEVIEGAVRAGTFFEVLSKSTASPESNPLDASLVFTANSANGQAVNDWQRYNFWVHRDDILGVTGLGINEAAAVQAQRPIIEYFNTLQLNSAIDQNGNPNQAGAVYVQGKTRFNQIPQFDLFRYDGTHAGLTSGIWYYKESQEFPVDADLQRRAEVTSNFDFIFSQGLIDSDKRHLYFKDSGEIKSIWAGGVTSPTLSNIVWSGSVSDASALQIANLQPAADNQTWTVEFVSATKANVSGTRAGAAAEVDVGQVLITDDFDLLIQPSTTSYVAGQKFTFRVHNKVAPRYIRDVDGQTVENYPYREDGFGSGYDADRANVVPSGAWLASARMYQNLNRENRSDIAFADFLNHARSVLRAQNGFTGNSFGNNNSRLLDVDAGRGGRVREFDSNFPLLASMLIQEELTPLTIIDFAEQQYALALASVDQYISQNLVEYISNLFPIPTAISIDPNDPNIIALRDQYEEFRSADYNLSTIYSDTTAGIKNWPITLPMMGLLAKTEPTVIYDPVLDQNVIQHHDGHFSALIVEDPALNRDLAATVVTRSDGALAPGIISNVQPTTPYARQLWFTPQTGELKVFAVEFDASAAPQGTAGGQFWFNRTTQEIRVWDATTISWQPSSETVSTRFVALQPENVRNSLILSVEQKLHDSVHPLQHMAFDITTPQIDTSAAMEFELARYATKYDLDPQSTDYDASNAFTWNYSSVVFPAIGSDHTRWNDVYAAYFQAFGISDFFSPDLEPWKLQGFSTKPTGWDAQYLSTIVATANTTTARLVSTTNQTTPLMGLRIVDGVQTAAGNKVLLANQIDASQNGIFVVSSGGWIRSTDVLEFGLTVDIQEGANADTSWVVTTANPIVTAVTDVEIQQVRTYTQALWDEIRALHPGIKLCVNTITDQLIPPYVPSSSPAAADALTTATVDSRADPYLFGQNGPVESVWERSLEYLYARTRTCFKLYPLRFLDSVWGDTYIQPENGLRVERNLQRSLDHKSFLLHGERVTLNVERSDARSNFDNLDIEFSNDPAGPNTVFTGTIDFVVSHVGNSNDVSISGTSLGKSATVFDVFVNKEPLIVAGSAFSVVEGQPFTFSVNDLNFNNVTIFDKGIPFEYLDVLSINIQANITSTSTTTVLNNDSFIFGPLGCEGCVSPGTPDTATTQTSNRAAWTATYSAASSKTFLGLCQVFTNLLRYSFVDTQVSSIMQSYRGWDTKLIHRLGALIRPDSLQVVSQSDKIPDTGYDVILKKSSAVDSLWIAGLRIQLLETGASKISSNLTVIPSTDASDWIFRIESYSAANPVIQVNELDTTGDFVTFNVLDRSVTDTVWKRYTTALSTQSITLPLQVQGLQNVINVIFGYVDQLEENNFATLQSGDPDVDQETGRIVDWQLDVEKMIRNVYLGIEAGEAAGIMNPFMNKLTLKTPRGLVGRYKQSKFMDAFSSQSCFDVIGSVIPVEQLSVIRTDEKTATYSKTPIFSAHLMLDEYEHAIIFEEAYSQEDNARKIFDQFLGQWKNSVFLEYYRQATPNGKPTFNGYVLQGNNVSRNIVSSIDALQNAYDANNTFADSTISKHAMSLIGFNTKGYFDNIGINAKTQLDFWRGMISAKGTNLAIDAFTRYKEFSRAAVDEFWAYKVAEYGDFREKAFPEIKISPSDCYRQFASFQFFNKNDPTYTALPLFTQVEAFDDTRWFSIGDLGTTLRFDSANIEETVFTTSSLPTYIRLKNIFHNGDACSHKVFKITRDINGVKLSEEEISSAVINANTIKTIAAGEYVVRGHTWLTPSKLSPIKLFDHSNKKLELQIGLWHPAIGVHAYAPLELVNMQISSDPASYNYSTKTENNKNLIELKPWSSREVGRIWWDTSKLSYTPYYDASIFPSRETRNSRWGALAEWASVDLYEWTASPVHPSEYDALAAGQEGDSSIDQRKRLSGRVGFTKYYESDRTVKMRPIAWSRAGISVGGAHPAFGSFAEVRMYAGNDALIAGSGRLADIQLTAGRRFGGWDQIGKKPVGEVVIGSNIGYVIGSSTDVSEQVIVPNQTDLDNADVVAATINLAQIRNSSMFGVSIGPLSLSSFESSGSTFLRMQDQEGTIEDAIVRDFSSSVLPTGTVIQMAFERFGVQLNIEIQTDTAENISAAHLASILTAGIFDVFIREYVNYSNVINLPTTEFSNEVVFGQPDVDYGWRAWDSPTQAELNADLAAPNNTWQPYLGDQIDIPVISSEITASMTADSALILQNGIPISRYQTIWTPWVELMDSMFSVISDGVDNVSVDVGGPIENNRISVYVNGIQIAPNRFVISGNEIVVSELVPEGHTVTVLYRARMPSESELSFDPDVKENFKLLTRYKKDYEYTRIEMRDALGNKNKSVYYFWVKNKTVPAIDKSMSMTQAKSMLQFGDTSYALFARLVDDARSDSGAAFDSCSISGLNYRITKNDTYKLRFMRDFTLRDDPEELKLKNVHTEWALIRERQNTKIPTSLWALLTDAVCGQDIAGNILPSSDRVSYDQKYGTRARYGFGEDQIFVDSDFALSTLVSTIVNTQLTIDIGTRSFTDYITMFNLMNSSAQDPATIDAIKKQWFPDPVTSRRTMDMIFATARPQQINELFFAVLSDALSSNYEFSDIFKTSFITVNSSTRISPQNQTEQVDEFY